MAEFVFKDMLERKGISELFYVASAATSTEEIGNPVHYGTRKILNNLGISTDGKRAVQMTAKDYSEYDYIVTMDQRNITNINRFIIKDTKNKVQRLLDYSSEKRDIADPWYTGDFEQTYEDVYDGCEALLQTICEEHHIQLGA
jgi:Protein-tyrosine-phosphatase